MPKAIGYIRFSSSKQITSNSKQRQSEMIARWLESHPDYTLSDLTFEDLGRSGFHGHHAAEGGGWAKLLAAVEAGAIKAGDAVLVEALDRTGRLETVDALHYLNPILRADVSVITLDDGNVYSRESLNGPQIYLLVAKIQAAHGYSKLLSERTKLSYQARKDKAKQGMGVKRLGPVWLTTDGKLREEIAPYIKQAFELYVSGVGKITIANRLRASGVEAFKTCSGPTVEGWLRNKSAIGYWDDIPDVYPPVVSRELFLQAQKRQKEATTGPRTKTTKHLLVGLVKCGVCGGNYIMQSKDGEPHSLRCLTRQRLKDNGCSNTRTIPRNVLEYVRLQTSHYALAEAMQRQQLTVADKRRLEVESEIDGISARIQKIVALLVELDDITEVAEKLKSLKAQRQTLQDELLLLERTDDQSLPAWETAYTENNIGEEDPVRLNAMLQSVGYTITVYPDGLIKASNDVFPFFYLGVKRRQNAVLGYRVSWSGEEKLVQPQVISDELKNFVDSTEKKKPESEVERLLYLGGRARGNIS